MPSCTTSFKIYKESPILSRPNQLPITFSVRPSNHYLILIFYPELFHNYIYIMIHNHFPHSLPHFDTNKIRSSILLRSYSTISASVGGGGWFFGLSTSFFGGPLFSKFGESLSTVTPPYVSPTNKIGSIPLNDTFVNFGFFTGFLSAKLECFSTLTS